MSHTVIEPDLSFVSHLVTDIDAAMEAAIAAADLPDNLRQAVAYSVSGGKRLRPILVLLSSEACGAAGGESNLAMPAGVAIELIHCFSLVHDDLPAMDDDDMRRGRPTLHVQAGEAMAILAGDLMVSLAFQSLAGHEALDGDRRSKLVHELAEATTAMIAGQVYDTLGGFDAELDDLRRLHLTHRKKTGALLRAACRMGAIAAGADDRVLESITRYGESVGLMFQIVDDLLDVTESTEHLGKAAGKDESAGKLTFPGQVGIEASRRQVARLRETALESLGPLGDAAGPLRELCDFLAVRTK